MLERFYQKIFIAIVVEEKAHEVTVTGVKNGKILFKERKRFEESEPTPQLFTYIRKYIEQSPLHYISLLNPDLNQGVLSGCSMKDVAEEVDSSGIKMVCRNKKWMMYASVHELENLKKRYKSVGLDFIFSPFSVLEYFFADKIGGDFALYVLAQKDSFSIVFFDKGNLEYAHNYSMHPSQMLVEETSVGGGFALDTMYDEEEKGIRLDEIETLDDLDIIDELDNLSDIEDLDSLDEIAEFSEDIPTYEEERVREPQGKELKEQMDRFNDDYRRFELIQRTLTQFYAGEHCRDRFVETVYIADAYGSGAELKRYLEEELFLSVLIRKIDLGDAVISLARVEKEGE